MVVFVLFLFCQVMFLGLLDGSMAVCLYFALFVRRGHQSCWDLVWKMARCGVYALQVEVAVQRCCNVDAWCFSPQ